MKRRLAQALFDAHNAPRITEIRVRESDITDSGYVVGLSDDFVLLHSLNDPTMTLNGYLAIPRREIVDVDLIPDDAFQHQGLRIKGQEPRRQPDILLLDFPGLLSSADAHFPLIKLEVAHRFANACYIGRVAKLTEKSVTLREISPSANWDQMGKYRFKDITRVEFGDGYTQALWRVAEQKKQLQENQ